MRQHEHPNSPSIVLLQNLTLELPWETDEKD
jgi:hypothetical protein